MSEALSFRAFVSRSVTFFRCGAHFGLDLRRWNCGRDVWLAHQVVGRACECEDPIHLADTAMSHLPQQRNRLQPAKTFFDSLPLALAHDIAGVPRRVPINRTAAWPLVILRHVGRNTHIPAVE